MSELRDEKLDFWIKNNLNVLIKGHYGIGKTTRIIDAFKRAGLSYKYFSAATMDPWVDFIGTPSASQDEQGKFLELILPKDMRDDIYDVFFMDELNRSHKKVRNAIMELIQFKTMNGRPFHRLKMVWGAINPEEEGDYQVEPLDKTQTDRFHVHVSVPYKPTRSFFVKKYSDRIATAALSWWDELPTDQKGLVSPRRLEYALDVYMMPGGDIRDVLPHGSSPSRLLTVLDNGPPIEKLQEFYSKKDKEGAKRYLAIENNTFALQYITDTTHLPAGIVGKDWLTFFLPLLPSEKLSALVAKEENVFSHMVQCHKDEPTYRAIFEDIVAAGTNKSLANKIKKAVGMEGNVQTRYGRMKNVCPEKPYYNLASSITDWTAHLAAMLQQPMDKTPQRARVYTDIVGKIPQFLNGQESIDTLELLAMLADRTWGDKVKTNLPHIIGVVNHCIDKLNKATGLSWYDMLGMYGDKIQLLLDKLKEANMLDQLLTPDTCNDIGVLVGRKELVAAADKVRAIGLDVSTYAPERRD